MKKVRFIIIIFILILCSATKIYATNTLIQFGGKDELLSGQIQVVTLNIKTEENVGVIQGTLNCDSGITDLYINSNYNGWLVTYNKESGKFNAFNATGTKDGDVLQLSYKLKDNAQKGKIEVKDIELTTTSYKTIEVAENVVKNVNKVEIEKEPDNNNDTDDAKQGNTIVQPGKKDNTISSEILPATGKSIVIIIAIILGFTVMIIIGKKVKEYKEIR